MPLHVRVEYFNGKVSEYNVDKSPEEIFVDLGKTTAQTGYLPYRNVVCSDSESGETIFAIVVQRDLLGDRIKEAMENME